MLEIMKYHYVYALLSIGSATYTPLSSSPSPADIGDGWLCAAGAALCTAQCFVASLALTH